jgi:WD40 repeat protein
VAFSPDGRLLAAPTSAGIALIDPATGRVTRTLPAGSQVSALAFDGAGALLATGGEDGGSVLDVAGGRPVAELDARLPVGAVAFEPGGRVLDAALQDSGNGAVAVSAARGGRELRFATTPNAITSLVASPDGRLVVGTTTGDPTVKVWDGRTMRLLRLLAGHTGEVTDAAFSPRGRLVATASADGTVRVWDAQAGTQLRVIQVAHPVSVAFTPDGSRLAIGDGPGNVSIWDACSGCENPRALLAIARTRVTRSLTPVERATFLATR